MTRAAAGFAVGLALVAGLALRLTALDARPMHHDEANQAVKFGGLLERGEYTYDGTDHHGPTLYYLTLPAAWMRGQRSLADLDETTIRLVPVAFGMAVIALVAAVAWPFGRRAAVAAAVLAAVSPAFVYYSRFYIQETLFVAFSLGFVGSLGRYARDARLRWAILTGLCGGLAYATKETFVIVLAAALVALAGAIVWTREFAPEMEPRARAGRTVGHAMVMAAVALAVAAIFFTSFFSHPSGFIESFRAYGTYLDRGVGPRAHAYPPTWYLGLLAWSSSGGLKWSEAAILVLATLGLVAAVRRHAGFWARFVALDAVLVTAAFSLLRYKTPWNLLPFYSVLIVMAGFGAAAALDACRRPAVRAALAAVLVLASGHLAYQSWLAGVRYGADERNPYAYLHTRADFLGLVERVHALAAVHADHDRMLVKVLAGPYEQWPLPWYLRRMTRVGYWPDAGGTNLRDGSPVIVAAPDQAAPVDAALGDAYTSELYGLRSDVFLTLYVEPTLWQRYLRSRNAAQR
jgi:uncharacterized protein (TIGR03663 family)